MASKNPLLALLAVLTTASGLNLSCGRVASTSERGEKNFSFSEISRARAEREKPMARGEPSERDRPIDLAPPNAVPPPAAQGPQGQAAGTASPLERAPQPGQPAMTTPFSGVDQSSVSSTFMRSTSDPFGFNVVGNGQPPPDPSWSFKFGIAPNQPNNAPGVPYSGPWVSSNPWGTGGRPFFPWNPDGSAGP